MDIIGRCLLDGLLLDSLEYLLRSMFINNGSDNCTDIVLSWIFSTRSSVNSTCLQHHSNITCNEEFMSKLCSSLRHALKPCIQLRDSLLRFTFCRMNALVFNSD